MCVALTCHVDISVLWLGIDFSPAECVITRLIKQQKNQEKKGPESKQRVDKTTLFPKIEKKWLLPHCQGVAVVTWWLVGGRGFKNCKCWHQQCHT